MLNNDGVKQKTDGMNELGTVLCSKCGKVLYTLPSNGVKKIYGKCDGSACVHDTKQDGELMR